MKIKQMHEEVPRHKYDKEGRELMDPRPKNVPIKFTRNPETLSAKIARMVREELSEAASKSGLETFDEADDFDVDDPEMDHIESPYEENFDHLQNYERDWKSKVEAAKRGKKVWWKRFGLAKKKDEPKPEPKPEPAKEPEKQ